MVGSGAPRGPSPKNASRNWMASSAVHVEVSGATDAKARMQTTAAARRLHRLPPNVPPIPNVYTTKTELLSEQMVTLLKLMPKRFRVQRRSKHLMSFENQLSPKPPLGRELLKKLQRMRVCCRFPIRRRLASTISRRDWL